MKGTVDDGAIVGARSRVWAGAHVLAGAIIGEDCNIGETVFVEGKARVGDRVTIKNGVQLWDGIQLEDDVFVGPNVTFCNDKYPRSKVYPPGGFPQTLVGRWASLGANCTILPGLTIGRGAMIGAGSVVTRSVLPYSLVVGNPARHVRFLADGKVAGASVEESASFPFDGGGRFALLTSAVVLEPSLLAQTFVCTSGEAEMLIDNGSSQERFILDAASDKRLVVQPNLLVVLAFRKPQSSVASLSLLTSGSST